LESKGSKSADPHAIRQRTAQKFLKRCSRETEAEETGWGEKQEQFRRTFGKVRVDDYFVSQKIKKSQKDPTKRLAAHDLPY